MTLHHLACRYATITTTIIREPIAILLFPVLCAAFVLVGWLLGATELFLLILTTVLSVFAISQSQMVMLKQGKDAGEIEVE